MMSAIGKAGKTPAARDDEGFSKLYSEMRTAGRIMTAGCVGAVASFAGMLLGGSFLVNPDNADKIIYGSVVALFATLVTAAVSGSVYEDTRKYINREKARSKREARRPATLTAYVSPPDLFAG